MISSPVSTGVLGVNVCRSSDAGRNSTASHPLAIDNPEAIGRFARLLKEAGYPGGSMSELLGRELGRAHHRRDLPVFLRKVSSSPALETLIKLFAFQVGVEVEQAGAALGQVGIETLIEPGLVGVQEGLVVPAVAISLCEGLFIAHDPASRDSTPLKESEHVLGINPPTLLLARLTARRNVEVALDLGTGCGIQALLCAAHCGKVIATDLNARALNLAVFNAQLNGIKNVEFRLGSLFEPVAGEKFDLIVCNPPYVISPASEFLFRDGGKSADSFCEELIQSIPSYLKEGGFASVLCNWAHYTQEHWAIPVRRWVEKSGCDAWLLHGFDHEPLSYAADWNRHRETRSYERILQEWQVYYEKLGIRSISSGGVVLRLRSGSRNWTCEDELPERVPNLNAEIARVFEIQDFLAAKSDEDLLRYSFAASNSHRIVQTMNRGENDYLIEGMRLETTSGLPFHAALDQHTLQLLRRMDGKRTLQESVDQLAESLGADPSSCYPRGIEIVRGLLAHGVLTPC